MEMKNEAWWKIIKYEHKKKNEMKGKRRWTTWQNEEGMETWKELIMPVGRARRVVLGTDLERWYHVPGRIPGGITLVAAHGLWWTPSVLDFLDLWFKIW